MSNIDEELDKLVDKLSEQFKEKLKKLVQKHEKHVLKQYVIAQKEASGKSKKQPEKKTLVETKKKSVPKKETDYKSDRSSNEDSD